MKKIVILQLAMVVFRGGVERKTSGDSGAWSYVHHISRCNLFICQLLSSFWDKAPPLKNSTYDARGSIYGCLSRLAATIHWSPLKINYTPKKLTCPLKRDHFNRKYIFQPLIFTGHSFVFQGDPGKKMWKSPPHPSSVELRNLSFSKCRDAPETNWEAKLSHFTNPDFPCNKGIWVPSKKATILGGPKLVGIRSL